jgi:hypothetical protein
MQLEQVSDLPEGDTAKIIAATLRETPDGFQWLVAVRNDGELILCEARAISVFFDVDLVDLGDTVVELRSSAYYDPERDVVRPCLGPGEVGVGAQFVSSTISRGQLTDVSEVARVSHGVIGKDGTGVVPFNEVALLDVAIHDASGAQLVSGSFVNSSARVVTIPQVWFYPLNSVGRPLAQGFWFGEDVVSPGASAPFEIQVEGPIGDYAVFHEQDLSRL